MEKKHVYICRPPPPFTPNCPPTPFSNMKETGPGCKSQGRIRPPDESKSGPVKGPPIKTLAADRRLKMGNSGVYQDGECTYVDNRSSSGPCISSLWQDAHETTRKILLGTPREEKIDEPKLMEHDKHALGSNHSLSLEQPSCPIIEGKTHLPSFPVPSEKTQDSRVLHMPNQVKRYNYLNEEELKMLRNKSSDVLEFLRIPAPCEKNVANHKTGMESFLQREQNKGLQFCKSDVSPELDNKVQEELCSLPMQDQILQKILFISYNMQRGRMNEEGMEFASFYRSKEKQILATLFSLQESHTEQEEMLKALFNTFFAFETAAVNDEKTMQQDGVSLQSQKAFENKLFINGPSQDSMRELSSLKKSIAVSVSQANGLKFTASPTIEVRRDQESTSTMSNEEHMSELCSLGIEPSVRLPVENSCSFASSLTVLTGNSEQSAGIFTNAPVFKDFIRSLMRTLVTVVLEGKKATAPTDEEIMKEEETAKESGTSADSDSTEDNKIMQTWEVSLNPCSAIAEKARRENRQVSKMEEAKKEKAFVDQMADAEKTGQVNEIERNCNKTKDEDSEVNALEKSEIEVSEKHLQGSQKGKIDGDVPCISKSHPCALEPSAAVEISEECKGNESQDFTSSQKVENLAPVAVGKKEFKTTQKMEDRGTGTFEVKGGNAKTKLHGGMVGSKMKKGQDKKAPKITGQEIEKPISKKNKKVLSNHSFGFKMKQENPDHPTVRIKWDNKSFSMNGGSDFPEIPRKIDVRFLAVRMITASGKGGAGGSSNSGGNISAGGSSNGGDWGGARPKTHRINNGQNNGGSGGDDPDKNRTPTGRTPPDSLPAGVDVPGICQPSSEDTRPMADYKRYRKKQHGTISNEQLCHCLGKAGAGIGALHGTPELKKWLEGLDKCLVLCLHHTQTITSPSLEDLACCTCAVLHSLLCHFSSSAHGADCTLCLQLFTLVQFHVQQCPVGREREPEGNEEEGENQGSICLRMRSAGLCNYSEAMVAPAKVWVKVRKYLSAALGPVLLLNIMQPDMMEQQVIASEQKQGEPNYIDEAFHSADLFTSGKQPLQDQAEVIASGELAASYGVPGRKREAGGGGAPPSTATSQAGNAQVHGIPSAHAATMQKSAKDPLRRKPSVKVVPQKTIPEEPASMSSSTHDLEAEAEATNEVFAADLVQTPQGASASGGEAQEEGEDIMVYIEKFQFSDVDKDLLRRQLLTDPYSTQPTYGQHGTVSMPEPREPDFMGNQTLSVENRPTGVKGIGEVVYGTIQQLRLVAHQWSRERDRCRQTRYCEYQIREEGVILHPFKKQLVILRTRYQKHQQWERLVHLGNGVQGKCHLCIDRTSNFKFCCKRVHILRYDDQELDIWSGLEHTNIVRFYGALRHGEKIYLFAEFIDGGSLTAMINEQRLVGRRLSHWTALNYFRQILHILIYLQTKGILHEDIKADNLLLRQGSTEIILADFGTAQKIPHDHAPPNRAPTGSPAHWAPEKATSEGHGFPSDLWAAACVLIHMLSGNPPWIVRFANAAILHYVIYSNPAPMEDVPADVRESVRDLIQACLVKDKAIRPSASQILTHRAFQLLDQSGSFFSTFNPPVLGLGAAANNVDHPARSPRLPQDEEETPSYTYPETEESESSSDPSVEDTRTQLVGSQLTERHTGNSGPQSLPACLHQRLNPNHAALRRKTSDPLYLIQETSTVGERDGRSNFPNIKTSTPQNSAGTQDERIRNASSIQTADSGYSTSTSTSTSRYQAGNIIQSPREESDESSQRHNPGSRPEHISTKPADLTTAFHPAPWPDFPSPVLTQALTASMRVETSKEGIYTTAAGLSTPSSELPAWRLGITIPAQLTSGTISSPHLSAPSSGFSSCSQGHGASTGTSQMHQMRGIPSVPCVAHPGQAELSSSPGQPTSTSALPNATAIGNTEYPPLSEDDIQVRCDKRFLSMIPEAVGQESLSPSAQAGSCGDDSSDEAIFCFIQDQLAGEVNQQEHQQSMSFRPLLQPYGNPPETSGQSNPYSENGRQGLPNFTLLSINSFTSTLKSGRIHSAFGDSLPASGYNEEAHRFTTSSSSQDAQQISPLAVEATAAMPNNAVATARYTTGKTASADVVPPQSTAPSHPGIAGRIRSSPGNSDEDHISSGDMFGSGPSGSRRDFLEASQYREKQLWAAQERGGTRDQQSAATMPITTAAAAGSPGSNRKHPNLRLKVNSIVNTSTKSTPASRIDQTASDSAVKGGERVSTSPQSANSNNQSRSSTQDDVSFLLESSTSPLTASPYTPGGRQVNDELRSRNGSGSSLSTPKSSTFDKQDHEWAVLQQESPLELSLNTEDFHQEHLTSSSTCASVTNPHLLYHPMHDEQFGQEESLMLSCLQEEIADDDIGGQRMTFTDEQGNVLFVMRIPNLNKGWKELAQTFRGKIRVAGFHHFTLFHQDGVSPVDYFTYDSSITLVRVIEVPHDDRKIAEVCWCEDHLVY